MDYQRDSYTEESTKSKRNWPMIILGTIVISSFIVGIVYIMAYFYNQASEQADSLLNVGSQNQEIVCDEDSYNCDDFSNKEEAQDVFDSCQDRGFGDIHGLDGDNNGIACESLN